MRAIRAIQYQSPWLMLVIWILVTGGLLYWAGIRAYDDYLFSDHAATTTGTVVQKYITESHGRHGTTYHRHISFNYRAGNVEGFCEMEVQYGTYYYLQTNGPIPVMYLPESPQKVRVNLLAEDRSIRRTTYFLEGLGALFLIGGIVAFALTFRSNTIYQRLWREGEACRGTVSDVPFDYVGKGRVQKFYLKFQFRDNAGNDICGRSWYLPREQEGRWREGDSIDVRYDRQKPRWFTIDLNPDRTGRTTAGWRPNSRA